MLAYVCTAFLAAPAAVSGATAADQSSPLSLVNQGYQSLMAGETTNAISAFSEAIESRELAPEQLANALLNRGLAHQQAAQYQDSVDDYAAALRIDALSAELRATALYNRGLAYQKLGQPALAIEDFTSALLLDPHFAHAYFSRGTVLRESGQYLFALSDYEKALRYNHPQAYLIYYGEALAQEQLKRSDLAQQLLAKAIAANPAFAPARQKLAGLAGVQPTVTSADALVTGSVAKTGDDQIVRKEALPEPVKPPLALAQENTSVRTAEANISADKAAGANPRSQAKPPKLFNDRVPQEEIAAAPSLVVQSSAAQKPKKLVAKSETAEIKILDVEPLPDAEPAADAKVAVVEPAAAEPAAAEPAAAEPALPDPAKLTGWSVQISSAKDEKLAWGTWSALKAKHDILADQKPLVLRADLGTKGIYYRLRIGGFDSQSGALGMCAKLKSRGIACFVSKINS